MEQQQTQHRLQIIAAILLTVFPLSTIADKSITTSEDPQALFAGTTEKLLLKLRDNSKQIKTDRQVAYDISDELIVPYLDFPRITQLVIGKHWRTANPGQKEQLTGEIRQMLIRSYVFAMMTYADQIVMSGEHITYLPSRYKKGDRKTSVKTTIQFEDGDYADVDYMLHNYGDSWKIYDIRVGGISLAITYRTNFSAEIQNVGLDGLIAKISEKNRKGTVEFPGTVSNQLTGTAAPR